MRISQDIDEDLADTANLPVPVSRDAGKRERTPSLAVQVDFGALSHRGRVRRIGRRLKNVGRSCYVRLDTAPNSVFKTFKRGREALTELTVRHPDLALPRAWLGMWYALNVLKGASDDRNRDTQRARADAAGIAG